MIITNISTYSNLGSIFNSISVRSIHSSLDDKESGFEVDSSESIHSKLPEEQITSKDGEINDSDNSKNEDNQVMNLIVWAIFLVVSPLFLYYLGLYNLFFYIYIVLIPCLIILFAP